MKNKHTWGAAAATASVFGIAVAAVLVPSNEPSTETDTLLTVSAPTTTAVVTTPPTTEPPTTVTTAPPTTTTERVVTPTTRASRGVARTTLPPTTTTLAPEVPDESTTTTVLETPAPPPPDDGGGFTWYEASWYGPGFYGNRTACGQTYSDSIPGTAHKTLACGTMVTFRYQGRTVTVPVIDRGPYTKGRTWDLSARTCRDLGHCHTGPIEARY